MNRAEMYSNRMLYEYELKKRRDFHVKSVNVSGMEVCVCYSSELLIL